MKRKLRFELRSYEDDDGLYCLEVWCGEFRSLHQNFRTMTERKLAVENIYKALKKLGGKVLPTPFERRKSFQRGSRP